MAVLFMEIPLRLQGAGFLSVKILDLNNGKSTGEPLRGQLCLVEQTQLLKRSIQGSAFAALSVIRKQPLRDLLNSGYFWVFQRCDFLKKPFFSRENREKTRFFQKNAKK